MLRKINALIPSFLKEFDRQLLLNRPAIWATRIHFVLFAGLVGMGLIAFYTSIQSIDLGSIPNPDAIFVVIAIPTLLGLAYWGWNTAQFDVEKIHGKRHRGHRIQHQLLIACGVIMLAILPFIGSQVTSKKIAKSVAKQTLIEDANAFNLGVKYFPSNPEYNKYNEPGDYQVWVYHSELYSSKEVEQIRRKLRNKDAKLLVIQNFIKVYQKYGGEIPETDAATILERFGAGNAVILSYAEHDIVNTNMNRVEDAQKKGFGFQHKDFNLLWGIIASFLWLAILVFQKNTWQNFVLSIFFGAATLIGGMLLSGGFIEFTGISSYAPISFFFLLVFGVMLYQAYRDGNTRRLNLWKGVSLNIATAMTPFIPLLLVLIFDNSMRDDTIFMILYVGIAFTVLIWNAAYNHRFVDLQSNPKEN